MVEGIYIYIYILVSEWWEGGGWVMKMGGG